MNSVFEISPSAFVSIFEANTSMSLHFRLGSIDCNTSANDLKVICSCSRWKKISGFLPWLLSLSSIP